MTVERSSLNHQCLPHGAMSETNLKSLHPDDALAQIPPPPNSEIHMPTSALSGSPILHYTCNSKYRIRLALENEKNDTIQFTSIICWPPLVSPPTHSMDGWSLLKPVNVCLWLYILFSRTHLYHRINQYHQQVLVSPILQIFNQLRANWVEESIQSTLDITDEGVHLFYAHDQSHRTPFRLKVNPLSNFTLMTSPAGVRLFIHL